MQASLSRGLGEDVVQQGSKGRESHLAELWRGLHACDYRREVNQEKTQWELDPMRHSESV